MNKKDHIHDWRKLKWPFTATFLYYSLLSLYTYFLCKKEENMQKLWFVFILAYVLISTQQLSILWQMMTAHVVGA